MSAGSALSMLGPNFGLLASEPHPHGPFGVMRKVGHGAGAALLLLSGAGALGGAEAATLPTPAVVDYSSIEGLTSGFLTGAFNSPLQIAGAVLLFIAAGQCVARFIGVIAVMAGFYFYSQGVTLADVFVFLGSFTHRLSAAVAAFSHPPV
jgi:hypothetical protein